MSTFRFDSPYWPAHVAVAWVSTRDEAFATARGASAASIGFLDGAILASKLIDGTDLPTLFADEQAVVNALMDAALRGKVGVIGSPFRQEGNIEYTGDRQKIDHVELDGMVFWDHDDGSCLLISKEWRISRESDWRNLRGYRGVGFSSDDILREFPRPPAGAAEEGQRIGRPRGSGALADDALLAEMEPFVRGGCSIAAAARRVSKNADGGGTPESKEKRLQKKYRKAHPG